MARWRLFSLWLAQAARLCADNCLRVWIVLEMARIDPASQDESWHLATVFLTVPALLLAPFYGALSNSLPKERVLGFTALAGLATILAAIFGVITWLAAWALIAVGIAFFSTRNALLPAAASDTGIALTRINGLFEVGAALAIVTGLLVAANLGITANSQAIPTLLAILHVASLVFLLTVRFASDVRRPEKPLAAVAGFFRDLARISRHGEARACLAGLAGVRAVVTAAAGAVVADSLGGGRLSIPRLIELAPWLFGGIGVGALLVSLQKHPRRVLGLVPLGATAFTLDLLLLALGVEPGPIMVALLGVTFALVHVPLAATYQADLPADARGNGIALRNFTDYLATTLVVLLLYGLAHWTVLGPQGQFGVLAGLALVLAAASWWIFRRPIVELILEALLLPTYDIRGHGPGLARFPMDGPAIVLANHATWIDPFFLGKHLPRTLIPMMTSVFFDLPGMRWIMVHISDAIRVEASSFRRDIPELNQAVKTLDQGKVLLVFPEGAMRKKAEQPLRQFGQGVWHILKQRPSTPVVVCWIEGGFGSFFSYYNGHPTKNKRLDFRRPIDVAVSEPLVLDPQILEDHRKTRLFLMQRCLETRKYAGLEPLAAPPLLEQPLDVQ